MSKRKNHQTERQEQRAREKRTDNTREKMMGRCCRRVWGCGAVSECAADDIPFKSVDR